MGRGNEQEKESLKKDYEDLLQNVREEYTRCNTELRQIVDVKTSENGQLTDELSGMNETYKREKNELQESMTKDKYTTDLYSNEIAKLRHAKQDFENERTSLFNDLKSLEQENERMFGENKELRKKTKKLEHILYGKK
jgi:predicted  nucleic acid-binding Zn-ribbon protein